MSSNARAKIRNLIPFALLGGILATLTACGEIGPAAKDVSGPIFWQETDEFTNMEANYLDARVSLNPENGQALDLQFQCFRHSGAEVSIEKILIVQSSAEAPNYPESLDAVLFKHEGEAPQIYSQGSSGASLVSFQNANLDLGAMLKLDERGNYGSLQLRFVYGASPPMLLKNDVGALSRSASVDFELSSTGDQTREFLRACAPVKNWVPPK